jgi:transcriptional regulator with XRE-family HTH domain
MNIKLPEWQVKGLKEARRLEDAGDEKGARRVRFGLYIYKVRSEANLTQEEAARRAGISRLRWIQIESGRIPSFKTLPKIADALSISVAGLYRRISYVAPRRLAKYDMKRAQKDFDLALLESETLAVFFFYLQSIWQQYKQEKLGLPKKRSQDPAHAEVLALVLEHLPERKRLELALRMVKTAPTWEKKSYRENPQRHFDTIDLALKNQKSTKGGKE